MAVFAYGFSKMYRQCLITKRVGNSIILDPIKRRVCYLVEKVLIWSMFLTNCCLKMTKITIYFP